MALVSAPACTSLRERSRTAPPIADAQVVGRIIPRDGAAIGRAVVFLDPIGGRRAPAVPAAVVISQRLGHFEPEFAVAAVGQRVLFSNQDKIFHGAFSYSSPNEFEQRPFAPGQTRAVTFRHPGVVRVYSPLYDSMECLILVAPDLHHAIASGRGDFKISGVPAGRYRLSLWTERYGEMTREISLVAGESVRADLMLRSPASSR